MEQEKGPQAPRGRTNTIFFEWMRMLAAARGADKITADGKPAIDAHPQTQRRLDTLLPVAAELYNLHAAPDALKESQRISRLVKDCKAFLKAKEFNELTTHHPTLILQRAAEPEKAQLCEDAARRLLVPLSLGTLRRMPPQVIGLQLIPQRSAWRLLRAAINRHMSKEFSWLKRIYNSRMNEEMRLGNIDMSKMQPLHRILFVSAVLDRAPPLIRALPAHWTSPATTDEMLEAQLALLKLRHPRSLAWLVDELSKDEYDRLVAEHSCLSDLLYSGTWTPNCYHGRRLVEYVAFLHFLQTDGGFKGLLGVVPPRSPMASQARRKLKVLRNDALAPDEYWTPAVSWPAPVEPAWVRQTVDPPRGEAKRQRPDEVSHIVEVLSHGPSESLPGVGAKRQRLDEGALWRTAPMVPPSSPSESRAPKDWRREAKNSLDVDVPLRLELAVKGDDKLFDEFSSLFPVGSAENDPVDWLRPLSHGESGVGVARRIPTAPSEQLSALTQPHGADRVVPAMETFPVRGNSAQLERSAGGYQMRSSSATGMSGVSVVPLAAAGAVAALGLVLLALVFRLRAGRSAHGGSRTHTFTA